MKKCKSCKKIKDLSEFSKCNTCKLKVRPECKKCYNKIRNEYFKTKEGLLKMIYKNQKTNSKIRGHRLPEYTFKELVDWCFSQKIFHDLHQEWKQSGYDRYLAPSVDRKHDEIHYCFQNLKLMTWKDNFEKSVKDKTGRKAQIHKKDK